MGAAKFAVRACTLLVLLCASCGGNAEVQIRGSGKAPSRTPTQRPFESPIAPSSTPTPTATATAQLPATVTATPTATPATTATPTPTFSLTPSSTETVQPTEPPEPTATRTPTLPSVGSPTATSTAPAATFTATALPPTVTATVEASATMSETPAPTLTRTPTPTPRGGGPACGNGLLENGETCESCPQDCVPSACDPSAENSVWEVAFASDIGSSPTSVTILLAYRSDVISIPGSGFQPTVRQRVTVPPPPPFLFTPNDLDYALRVVLSRTNGLDQGLLFTVRFDRCEGAPVPDLADFSCSVEGCAGAGGTIDGCACSVGAAP